MVSFTNLALAGLVLSVNGLSFVPKLKQDFQEVIKVFDSDNFQLQPEGLPLPPNKDEKPVPGDSPIIQCEASEAQILNLQSVIIEPNPPERGANLTVVAKGYLAKSIEEGAYVEVDVRYGFIKLIHQTFDLCEEIQKVDMECPIKAGEQIIMKEVEIPQEVPPGKYLVNARAYTKDDEFITCLSATVEFPAV